MGDGAMQHMQCMEVWGGSQLTSCGVEFGGLDAWVYSKPFGQAQSGGDVYYASSCATGRISRYLLPAPHQHRVRRLPQHGGRRPPHVDLHVVCDYDATHQHPNVGAWLDENPRVRLHFTPTSCSWLNMVEIFFGIITRQALRRGTFVSVADIEAAITTYIDAYNDRAKPFAWTKTADQLIGKIKRMSINNTRH